ncbi:hypothetical protein B9G69_002885 [Bdellovibrio sp. SKB1291214]|uniref:hypothetical protein n=1 Tax=Bdellovibrio sp. SKB1291214 TaxID=1732569 RepID=UPI000B5161C5|nr:hypothetical protein [Bdellovibrio sp. SKB1291214]UYL09518.1 hypothetical protein B9G69_002885 [Bdellovibrio sp. SKB1291214]
MNTKYLLTILLAGLTLFLANCSKSNSSGSSTTAGSCSAGYVYTTQYGCLPTAYCTQNGLSADYGYNQSTNQCIQGTYSYGNTTSGSPTCNGMTGYVSVNGTCLPEAGCTQYRGQNGVAFYGYKVSTTGQWACYPQGYTGQWYN